MRCSLTALPMPLPAPVTMATCPSNRRPGSKLPLAAGALLAPAGGGIAVAAACAVAAAASAAAVCWLSIPLVEHPPVYSDTR